MDSPRKPIENAFPSPMLAESSEFLKSGSTEFLCPDPLDPGQEHEPTREEHAPLFESDDEADAEEDTPLAQAVPKKKRGRKPSVKLQDAMDGPSFGKRSKPVKDAEEDDEPWVQCDRCAKWRKLESRWNKKKFSCSQLGISCEEDCDCDPPCDCKNNTAQPSQEGTPQPLSEKPAAKPRTVPSPRQRKRMSAKIPVKLPAQTRPNESEASHSDSDSGSSSEDNNLYCCDEKYNSDVDYVGCSSYGECKGCEWYHLECVKMTRRQAKNMEEWFCPKCTNSMTAEQIQRKRKAEQDSDGSFSDEEIPLGAKLELQKAQKNKSGSDSDDGDDVPLLSIVQGPSPKEVKNVPRPEKRLTPSAKTQAAKTQAAKSLPSPPPSADKKATPPAKAAERPKHIPADFATIRAKAREALQEVLGETLAAEIDESVLRIQQQEQAYKVQMRELVQNLRDVNNPELKARILNGDLSVEQLSRATAEDLASASVAVARSRAAEDAMRMAYKPTTVRAAIEGKVQETQDQIAETLFPSFPTAEQHNQPPERRVGFLNRKPQSSQAVSSVPVPTLPDAPLAIVKSFNEFESDAGGESQVKLEQLDSDEDGREERKHSSKRISLKHRSRHEKNQKGEKPRGEVRMMHARSKDHKHKKKHSKDRERKLPNPEHSVSFLETSKSAPASPIHIEVVDVPDDEIEVILKPADRKPPPPVAIRTNSRDPRLQRTSSQEPASTPSPAPTKSLPLAGPLSTPPSPPRPPTLTVLPLSSLDAIKLEGPVKVEIVKVEADSEDFEPKVLIASAAPPVTIDRSRDPRNRAVRPNNSRDPRLNR